MTSKNDRFFDPKDGTYANVPIVPIHREIFCGKRPFNTKVLIRNWYEDRSKFKESSHRSKPFYRIEYPAHVGSVPDTVFRRRVLTSKEQRPDRLILDHHDIDHQKQLISSYDEQYNRRGAYGEHQDTSERKWALQDNHWLPERSDHPLQSTPTSWGLVEHKRAQNQFLQRQRTMPDLSEYTNNYVPYRSNEYLSAKHTSIPRIYSSGMNRASSLNNNIINRREPPIPDPTDIDHVFSVRRNAHVPRAYFYSSPTSIQNDHSMIKTDSCRMESNHPIRSANLSLEPIQRQEQTV